MWNSQGAFPKEAKSACLWHACLSTSASFLLLLQHFFLINIILFFFNFGNFWIPHIVFPLEQPLIFSPLEHIICTFSIYFIRYLNTDQSFDDDIEGFSFHSPVEHTFKLGYLFEFQMRCHFPHIIKT